MGNYGMEMFLEICRFWASKAKFNGETGRYSIEKVMGPDEFHEQYPGAKEGGIRDNAYINIMVAWAFNKVYTIRDAIGTEHFDRVIRKIGLSSDALKEWNEISSKLNLCINEEGIIGQYDGYFDLLELDWDFYRKKYSNIYRMDRILKSENLSPDQYKVAKQADMLMTFYVLEKEEVDRIINKLGYTLPADYLQRNLEYYLQRTSHGSTLSRVVHSKLALLAGNMDLSWQLYSEALASDFNDIQGGTTGEGIHAGVMAGTILIALNTYAGVNLSGSLLEISPRLPDSWKSLEFGLTFKGVNYSLLISKSLVKVRADKNIGIKIATKAIQLISGQEMEIHITPIPTLP
jgi:trehalose/maltose hydrolase-like predicted phosphorylase